MENLVHQLKAFSKQIQFSIQHYQGHKIELAQIQNIVIGGLGGSGIAGRIVKNYFSDKLELPIEIISDYIFPRFVNSKSLIILSSYSGNSEETLALYAQAKERNAKVLVITSGGELEKLAIRDGFRVYKAESGYEARMGLGYSLTYLLQIIFELLGQYKEPDLKKIAEAVSLPDDYIRNVKELIKTFEGKLHHKYILVCDPPFEGLATRMVQKIQENAKLEAFVSVLPEANHNTLQTYHGEIHSNFIFLNSRSSHRTSLRFGFLKTLLSPSHKVLEVGTKDNTLFTLITTLYSMDWLALEIAGQLGIQAENNQIIVDLKTFLQNN